MSDQFNLLDLPDLVLEEIFSYCTSEFGEKRKKFENPLLNLTECCKFLKNYIGTNPKLMRKIHLRIPITHPWFYRPTREDEEANVCACLASTRKYRTVEFYFDSQIGGPEVDESEIEEKKCLADMHSESIKDVTFTFDATESDSKAVLNVLKYMENLTNVERVTVFFNWVRDDDIIEWKRHLLQKPSGWSWSDFGNSYLFPNEFKHLKHLTIEIECQTVFNIFENCKTIETLQFIEFGSENPVNYEKLQQMLSNSRETLKALYVGFETEERTYNFKDLLTALINSGINLKIFKLYAYSSDLEIIQLIIRFLASQKDLEILDLHIYTRIIKKFNEEFVKLSKLKVLKIFFKSEDEDINGEDQTDVFFTLPKLPELEELDLFFYQHKKKHDVSFRMSQFKSDKLKKISFLGHLKLYDSFFENISKNFSSLIELEVYEECSDYSSNDIFWILKHLKLLKKFKFVFPGGSELNPDLFDNNGNLSLPTIEDVTLIFNDSVGIDHAYKFVQLINNMTTFSFNFWKNYTADFLVLFTKELQNLNKLFVWNSDFDIDSAVLLKIQTNLQGFNKEPNKFKINGRDMRYWMDKAEKSEAGGSQDK